MELKCYKNKKRHVCVQHAKANTLKSNKCNKCQRGFRRPDRLKRQHAALDLDPISGLSRRLRPGTDGLKGGSWLE